MENSDLNSLIPDPQDINMQSMEIIPSPKASLHTNIDAVKTMTSASKRPTNKK